MEKARPKNVNLLRQFGRKSVSSLVNLGLPHEINPVIDGGIERARELSKEGYGIIVAYNHFSLRDAADIMIFLLKDPVLGKKSFVSPIAPYS